VAPERTHHDRGGVALLHADFHALHVGRAPDRLLRAVERACACVIEAEADKTLILQIGQNTLANRAVERASHMGRRLEEIGQGRNDSRRHGGAEDSEVDARHVQRAVPDLADREVLRI
jgi:hypothetical protein